MRGTDSALMSPAKQPAASPRKTAPSPWKKPKPTISMLRTKSLKRNSELLGQQLNDSVDSQNSQQSNFSQDHTSSPAKIRKTANQFAVTSSRALSQSQETDDLSCFFSGGKKNETLNRSDSFGFGVNKPKANVDGPLTPIPANVFGFACLGDTPKQQESTDTPPVFEGPLLPIDWSVKRRLRFVSTSKFTCQASIKSQHESSAVTNYAKFNTFYSRLHDSKQRTDKENVDLFKTLFCESTSYWTFPDLHWLKMFPRNIAQTSMSASLEPPNAEIRNSLAKKWNVSFKSLYNCLKCNECPYFYLLTNAFMVLFCAAGTGAIADMHAILTPSTKGLRSALSNDFSMPLNATSQRKSDVANSSDTCGGDNLSTSLDTKNDSASNLDFSGSDKEKRRSGTNNEGSKGGDEEEDDDEEDENGDEHDEWIENLGLNLKTSVLQRNSKNVAAINKQTLDNTSKSTLLFSKDGEVQALFNFLLNDKSCVASSGPMMGVPPTLISPTSFIGATLEKISVEPKVIKSRTAMGESLTQHVLEFNGPLMPYHLHRLCSLFAHTQDAGSFEMLASPLSQSEAFNCAKTSSENEDHLVDSDDEQYNGTSDAPRICSMFDESERASMEAKHGVMGEARSIRSITHRDGTYRCYY